MEEPAGPPAGLRPVRFGVFEVDFASRELRKHGLKIKVQDKPLQILEVLLEHPGRVVTRNELRSRLWGDDTFVDFERNLNVAITRLRAALGDSAESPRFIETLARRGYRFIPPVDAGAGLVPAQQGHPQGVPLPNTAAEAVREPPLQEAQLPQTKKSGLRHKFLLAGGVLAVLGILLIGLNVGGWRDRLRPRLGTGRIQSLAVLPLENLSRDPEQEYFADGMTEELIADLGQIGALRVISRTSAMHYKRTKSTLPKIARELHVDAVVEGSVLRSGDRVRITAQLIEATTERHLWAQTYERDLRDVLALQEEVARRISEQIRVKVSAQGHVRLASSRPVNPEAHEAYLRGLHELHMLTTEGTKKAIEHFQQALAHDPNDALVYAALAEAYHNQSTFDRAPLEVMPKAKAAAARAVELDDSLAEAHASLGSVKLVFDWDWPGAERELRRALELNPSLAPARAGYATYLLSLRRTGEAIEEFRQAEALDPFVQVSHHDFPLALFEARRYERAIEEARKVADNRVLALSYAELGRRDEAVAAADRGVESERNPVILSQIAAAYALAGRKDKARVLLDVILPQARQRYVCGYNVACAYAVLGDKEQAFAWLEKAYRDRSD